jgi:hypothetical protein
MSGLDMSQWVRDKCLRCHEEFLFWHEAPGRVCNTCERSDLKTVTRDQFRKAMEYGIDNASMKGNMIDVATEYLFGEQE